MLSLLVILLRAGGIGATTSIFAALDAIVLNPLEFRESENIFALFPA